MASFCCTSANSCDSAATSSKISRKVAEYVSQHRRRHCVVVAAVILLAAAAALLVPYRNMRHPLYLIKQAYLATAGRTNPSIYHELSHDACWSMQQQAAAEARHCYPVHTKRPLTLFVCTTNRNRSISVFTGATHAIQNLTQCATAGAAIDVAESQNVFRLRIVGPEIHQPLFQYCGGQAAANISVETAGSYYLELLQLYETFSFTQPPLVLRDFAAASFELEVPPPTREASNTAAGVPESDRGAASCLLPGPDGCQTSAANKAGDSSEQGATSCHSPKGCLICPSFNHHGRWVLTANSSPTAAAPLLQVLRNTCVKQHQPPTELWGCSSEIKRASMPAVEDAQVLEWLPYGCQYRKLSPADSAECHTHLGSQHQVCFVGDSHVRHMFNQVAHLVEGQAAKFRETIRGVNRQKEVLPAASMVYVEDYYGDRMLTFNSGNCSHVFSSFGQWSMSYMEPSPWLPSRYADMVGKVAQRLQAEQSQHHNQQYWLTIPPSPLGQNHQMQLSQGQRPDWRTDPFVLRYNEIASSAMAAHSIPVVDTFSIAAPLADLSYDAVHFLGTVGMAQANMVANIICLPPGAGATGS